MKNKIINKLPILVLLGLVIYALIGCNKPIENMHKYKEYELVIINNNIYSVLLATTNSNGDNIYYLDALNCHSKDCTIIVEESFIKPYKQP